MLKVCDCGSEDYALQKVCVRMWRKTNHLVLQDAIFLVNFGTLDSVTSGHKVVKLFFAEPFCPEVRSGQA